MKIPPQDPNQPPPIDPQSQWQAPPDPAKPYPRQNPVHAPDTLGGLIPADNPPSLFAYYCGLFSCFPVLGIILAIIALVQGRKALHRINENPAIHGKAHAWVGLICSGISLTYHLVFTVIFVMAALSKSAGS